jgi:hypothetical protein
VTEVTALHLVGSLPFDSQNELSEDSTLPWGFELTDGTRCSFIGGATASLNGERLNYGCSDGGHVYGGLDQSLPMWRAQYQAEGATDVVLREVAATWN